MTDDKHVAVLGFGLAGSAFHAPFVAATPGLRVGTVLTGNPRRKALAEQRYPDADVVSTVDDMLAARPDLVVVASPNRYHVEHAEAALRRGIPVVVDKPVAGTVEEVTALAELADANGVLFTAYQNRRWDGDFRTVRHLVDTGRLPAVARFESRFERVRRPGARSAWKTSTDPLDLAHIVYDIGSHLIDQALVLLGPVLVVVPSLSTPDTEDDVTLVLTHANSASSVVRMSNVAEPAGPRFTVSGPIAEYCCWGLDPQEAVVRAGTPPTAPGFGAYAEVQWGRLVTAGENETVPTMDGDYLGYWAMVEACLRGAGPPPVHPAETVRLVATVAAAMRAVRSGEPVVL